MRLRYVIIAIIAVLALALSACNTAMPKTPPGVEPPPEQGEAPVPEPTPTPTGEACTESALCDIDFVTFTEVESEQQGQPVFQHVEGSLDQKAVAIIDSVYYQMSYDWANLLEANGMYVPENFLEFVTSDDAPYDSSTCEGMISHDNPQAVYCSSDVQYDTEGNARYGALVFPTNRLHDLWLYDHMTPAKVEMSAIQNVGQIYGAALQQEIRNHMYSNHPGVELDSTDEVTQMLVSDCFVGAWTTAHGYETLDSDPADYVDAMMMPEAYSTPLDGYQLYERSDAIFRGQQGVMGFGPGNPLGCIAYYWE